MSNTMDTLRALRWSVNSHRNKKDLSVATLCPGIMVSLFETSDSPSSLGISLLVDSKQHMRILLRSHVETRGKSAWFHDNVWRLSEEGIKHFAPGIDSVIERKKIEGSVGD